MKKPSTNITHNKKKKNECFPPKIRNKDVYSSFPSSIVLEVPASVIRKEKRNKKHPDGEWRSKTAFIYRLYKYIHVYTKSDRIYNKSYLK